MDERHSESDQSSSIWQRRLLIAAGVLVLVAAVAWLSAGRVIAAKLEHDLRAAGFVEPRVVGASVTAGGVAVRRIRLAGDDLEVQGVRAEIGTAGVEKLSADALHVRAAVDANGHLVLPGARGSGDGTRGGVIDLVPPEGLEVASADVVLATPSGPAALRLTGLRVERRSDDARAEARYTLEHALGRLQGTAVTELLRDGALHARIGVEDGEVEADGVRAANLTGDLTAAVPVQGPAAIELELAAAETTAGERLVGTVRLTATATGRAVDFALEAHGPLVADVAITGRADLGSAPRSLEATGRARLDRDDARGELDVDLRVTSGNGAGRELSGVMHVAARRLTLPSLFSEGSFDLAADVAANAEHIRLTSRKPWTADVTPAPALLPESVRTLTGERLALTLSPDSGMPLAMLVTRDNGRTQLDAALGRVALASARDDASAASGSALLTIEAAVGGGGGTSVAASFDDGALTLPSERLTIGGIGGTVRVDDGAFAGATLTAAAVGSIAEPPLWAPLGLEASVRSAGAALELEALASDTLGSVVLEIAGRAENGRGKADVTLHPLRFVTGATQVEDVSPALAEHVTDASGGVRFAGTLEWDAEGMRSFGELHAEALSATVLGTPLSGVDGTVTLSSLLPPSTPPGQTLRVAALDVGVPLTDGVVVYGLEGDGRIAVQELTFDLAGGRVSTEPFTIDSGDVGDLRFVLEAEDVDLSQLLALSRIEGLEGTGALSGRVPVRVTESGIELDDGFLAAETRGTLRYTPEDLPEFLRGDDLRSRMLRDVLTNFQYDELAITITGDAEDDAGQLVQLAAKGANPDFLEGHPIELNFNFSGPLLGAVRSAVDLSGAEAVQQLFEPQDERDVESAP